MEGQSARFPRRELVVAPAGVGSVGAFAWIAVAGFGERGPSTETAATILSHDARPDQFNLA